MTYELCGTAKYSEKGLRMIAPKLTYLNDLPYTAAELRQEAEAKIILLESRFKKCGD